VGPTYAAPPRSSQRRAHQTGLADRPSLPNDTVAIHPPLAGLAAPGPRLLTQSQFAWFCQEKLTEGIDHPRHLGVRIGLTAVLHTWGSALTHHPHLHIIVPGGGLSPDGARWIACKPGFFLPVRVLSRLFRRLLLEGLAALNQAGRLAFFGDLAPLADNRAFDAALALLRRSESRVGGNVAIPTPQSGRTEARTGLRMMPTSPRSPLSFRTAGFPRYGWKAGPVRWGLPEALVGLSLLPAYAASRSVCLHLSCIAWQAR
jgi:hypothetical protein